jgi:hypothetical protein
MINLFFFFFFFFYFETLILKIVYIKTRNSSATFFIQLPTYKMPFLILFLKLINKHYAFYL